MDWLLLSKSSKLQRRARKKKEQVENRRHICLEEGPGLLVVQPEREKLIALHHLGAGELGDKIRKGEITAEEVMATFIGRSRMLGNKETNNVTEEMYDEAMAAAREFDRRVKQGDPALSSLLLPGVPISVKEHIDITGTDSTCGLAARCLQPKDKDALIITLLKDAGAIPFVKTNVPQGIFTIDTDNHIYGPAKNPWDTTRSTGGSSGGEGGLLAVRGSILGIGSDIGGSIRIPSHFCGVYGFLPTPSRTSTQGMSMPFNGERYGQSVINVSAGPLGHTVHDLTLVLRAWWVEKMWRADSSVPPLPFNQSLYETGGATGGRSLRIGYFVSDNWFHPCRAVIRGLHEAKAALEKAGCEVVEMPLPRDGWHYMRLYLTIILADGNFVFPSLLGEDFKGDSKGLARMGLVLALPYLVRLILRAILWLLGQKRLAWTLGAARRGGISTREYWEVVSDALQLRKGFMATLDQNGLDAFICPISGDTLTSSRSSSSSSSSRSKYMSGWLELPPTAKKPKLHSYMYQIAAHDAYSGCSYACLTNLLQWPGGVVPITTVRQHEAVYPLQVLAYCRYGPIDLLVHITDLPVDQRDLLAYLIAGETLKGSAGLPVGVQVVSRPYRDEVALHVMRLLEKHIEWKAMPAMAQRLVTSRATT